MSNVAVNDAGDVMIFRAGAWSRAPIAQNDQGARLFFDGTDWKDLPTAAPAAPAAPRASFGERAARAAGLFGAGFNERVAQTLGALPDLYNRGLRAVGLPALEPGAAKARNDNGRACARCWRGSCRCWNNTCSCRPRSAGNGAACRSSAKHDKPRGRRIGGAACFANSGGHDRRRGRRGD